MTNPSRLHGRAPFAQAALAGLARDQKRIACTWLYDQRGSELFEQITYLDEYYPTRTEIGLLRRHGADMAAAVGDSAIVVEIGSGSSRKTPLLLRRLLRPTAYVPVDIAPHCLEQSVAMLRQEFPALPMHPLVADFHHPLQLPAHLRQGRFLGFFPGSTIGNLSPREAGDFLRRMADCLGREAWMLVGVDINQDPASLLPAYDDAAGVTAAFNLNLLERLNRELGGDFQLDSFRHEARHDPAKGRMEMHLVSRCAQEVRLLGQTFRFEAGESIHTENSYKYPVARFQALAEAAGWSARQCWSDEQELFSLHLLARA